SVFVRAHTEPFNTEMELSEERLINWLRHFHINQHVGNIPITVHASGHASGPEILEMIRKIKPKRLYPVHTEKPQAFTKLSNICEVILPQKV
ncbi:MAG: MBL fold metallo-hydrolase RNA specificity domain-containing protein, partial [Thermoproteota archaeon]